MSKAKEVVFTKIRKYPLKLQNAPLGNAALNSALNTIKSFYNVTSAEIINIRDLFFL
jgi:hypothetical protein